MENTNGAKQAATTEIPTTPEGLQALIDQAKKEAYEKGAKEATSQSEKMISDLEAKVALTENNPLSFPRLTVKGKVMELTMIHPFSVREKNGKSTMYNPEDFVSDEIAQQKFGMKAKELLDNLFKGHSSLFVEK